MTKKKILCKKSILTVLRKIIFTIKRATNSKWPRRSTRRESCARYWRHMRPHHPHCHGCHMGRSVFLLHQRVPHLPSATQSALPPTPSPSRRAPPLSPVASLTCVIFYWSHLLDVASVTGCMVYPSHLLLVASFRRYHRKTIFWSSSGLKIRDTHPAITTFANFILPRDF